MIEHISTTTPVSAAGSFAYIFFEVADRFGSLAMSPWQKLEVIYNSILTLYPLSMRFVKVFSVLASQVKRVSIMYLGVLLLFSFSDNSNQTYNTNRLLVNRSNLWLGNVNGSDSFLRFLFCQALLMASFPLSFLDFLMMMMLLFHFSSRQLTAQDIIGWFLLWFNDVFVGSNGGCMTMFVMFKAFLALIGIFARLACLGLSFATAAATSSGLGL